jgi:hypothetical protein
MEHNPPTPNLLDISMHSLPHRGGYFANLARGGEQVHDQDQDQDQDGGGSGESDETARPSRPALGGPTSGSPPPPGYAPLDPHVYACVYLIFVVFCPKTRLRG